MDPIDQHLGVLGLRRGASKEELKAAYRALIQASHPDRFYENDALRKEAEARTSRLNEAYRALRAHYETLAEPAAPPAGDEAARAGRRRREEDRRRQDAEYRKRKLLREEREAWEARRLREQRTREAQTWFLGILFVVLLILYSAHQRRQAIARRPLAVPPAVEPFEPE